MKSSLEQIDDPLSTTSECKNLQIKENNHLFHHIDKLAADHDVIVTNTMIKITYKKALKDQNASDSVVRSPMEKNFQEKKNKSNSNDISFLRSPKGPIFHSTPKQPPNNSEKKKKYVNGLNLNTEPNNQEGKKNSTSLKVQKPSEDGGKSKNVINSDKRFLKESSGLALSKPSISRKGNGENKSTKGSDKKIIKLENGMKKKAEVNKKEGKTGGVKRKLSNTELNLLSKSKKIKISESEGKGVTVNGDGSVEEGNKSVGKKQIMLVDPELPPGWSRHIKTKNEGSANEQHIVYVVNPQGKKFRYKWKLRQYLYKTNSTLDPDQFFFGLYQRPKTSSSGETRENDSQSSRVPPVQEIVEKQEESSNDAKSSEGKELLLFDPNLPIGWKRIIHSNSNSGKKQVHIISPEGKVFRRRYQLNEYLIKNQVDHDLNKFYFGLYPKKVGTSENSARETEIKSQNTVKLGENSSKPPGSAIIIKKPKLIDNKINLKDFEGSIPPGVMFEDPNLPEGWKRFIKIRTCGESAGRMEVFIISPDGRRHRSKKLLQNYLQQNKLKYNVNDFDFTVVGKSNTKKQSPEPKPKSKPKLEPEPAPEPEVEQEPQEEPLDFSFLSMKKKFTDKPVPELDISSLKDEIITPEGHMINTVSGLMTCSGLTSARNERRQRLSQTDHEKQLKVHFSSETNRSFDGCEIPPFWVENLIKCRTEFRSLEPDVASTLAEITKEFLKTLSVHALANSEESGTELKYEHLAEIVDRTDCLSFLKTLIPKKITYREYIKLNRPKQFMSFT